MKQYPTAFRERALAALDRGVPRIQVARLLHVDPSTLSRWRREQARTGSVAPRRRTGRPPRISATDLPALRALVAAHPDATITEYQVLWAERTGQHVSGRALRRALGRAAITRKKTLIAGERDEAARARWRAEVQPTLDPATTVFLDETSTNTALARRYGWAPKGERVVDRVPRNWGPNVTVLAALGPRGIAASGAVPGAADGAVVAAYLREQLLPALAPGTAIVLDNLSSHRGRAVREAVAAAGGRLVFLPTYSPDLNPIEFAFSAAKERVRAARARSWDALWPAIGAALDAVTPAMATAMIAECGYG